MARCSRSLRPCRHRSLCSWNPNGRLGLPFSGAEALVVAIVHRLPQRLGTVFIILIVVAATTVSIDRRHKEIRVTIVIEPIIPEVDLLLTYAIRSLLLKTILRYTLFVAAAVLHSVVRDDPAVPDADGIAPHVVVAD